jgi:hypothetical protein
MQAVEKELEEEELKLTMDSFKKCLPTHLRGAASEELLGEINDIILNTELRQVYRDNLLTYTGVLKEGKFRATDYVRAVRYVTHKLAGDSNIVAYTKTFPERYQGFIDRGYSSKDINSNISIYNRGILVTKIMEQAVIPTWLVNQDLFQKALNVQADLMLNARSEKVRTDAANSLLGHLKMPEVAKVELDVNLREDDSIDELRRSTLELVEQQRKMIQAGAMKAGDVAKQKVVIGEVVSEQ